MVARRASRPSRASAAQPQDTLSLLRTLAATTDSLSRLGGFENGISFGGRRDLYSALGYKRKLTAADFRSRYKRNGLAARVVEAEPKATWRAGVDIVEDQDPEVLTAFEEAWEALAERLNIWSVFARLDILSGLGRYAVLILGVPGDPGMELPSSFNADEIMYLSPYGEDDAPVSKWMEDPSSERFGLPELYTIRTSAASGRVSKSTPFHHSRVLHVAEGMLDDRVYGQPRLERVWNYFDDMEKVVGGGSEAFWLRVHRGLMFNIDKDVTLNDQQKKDFQAAVEEYAHNMRRTVATRGMKVTELGSDVSNYNSQVDSLITLIAGATGIPKRILVGSERGELASSQDEGNWDDRIQERRSQHAEPNIVRAFLSKLFDAEALPQPETYEVRWPETHELTDGERADVGTKWAGLNTAAGGLVVTPEEIRDRILGLPKLEDATDAEPRPVFNGAQIDAAVAIVTGAADGSIPRDSAVALLISMLGLSEEDADRLVPPEPEEPPAPDPAALPPANLPPGAPGGPPLTLPPAPPAEEDTAAMATLQTALAKYGVSLPDLARQFKALHAGKAQRPPSARADGRAVRRMVILRGRAK